MRMMMMTYCIYIFMCVYIFSECVCLCVFNAFLQWVCALCLVLLRIFVGIFGIGILQIFRLYHSVMYIYIFIYIYIYFKMVDLYMYSLTLFLFVNSINLSLFKIILCPFPSSFSYPASPRL